MHRGSRLRAAFPAAATPAGDGLLTFDVERIRSTLNWPEEHKTAQGVTFTRWRGGQVSLSVDVQVGNSLGSWSWFLSAEQWLEVLAWWERVREWPDAPPHQSTEESSG